MAVQQSRQPLIAIGTRKEPARVTEREHEQMNLLRLPTDPDPELTVVDPSLLARAGLEAHRCQLRPPTLIAMGTDASLHLHQTASKTQRLQLAVKDNTVEADLRCAMRDKLGEAIQLTHSPLRSPRLPPAQREPALDRLTIHAEFACDLFDTVAPFPARDHLRAPTPALTSAPPPTPFPLTEKLPVSVLLPLLPSPLS